jgi:hypothetical protein
MSATSAFATEWGTMNWEKLKSSKCGYVELAKAESFYLKIVVKILRIPQWIYSKKI